MKRMQAGAGIICGRCGATSLWGERYYQETTPNTPFPAAYSFWGWENTDHHRAFCPKCGALVADRLPNGFGWTLGARPAAPGKEPTAEGEGGHWIFGNFKEWQVPYGKDTLDIDGLHRAQTARVAKEDWLRTASVPELIGRLRESKGKMAGDVEGELTSRGQAAVPFLIETLKDQEVYLRWRVCYVLAEMGDKAAGARPALELSLRDTEEPVRTGAADALRRIGQSKAS